MFQESQKRIDANKLWKKNYHPQYNPNPVTKALLVMLFHPDISKWLAINQPKALKQAQLSVSNTSWEDYL